MQIPTRSWRFGGGISSAAGTRHIPGASGLTLAETLLVASGSVNAASAEADVAVPSTDSDADVESAPGSAAAAAASGAPSSEYAGEGRSARASATTTSAPARRIEPGEGSARDEREGTGGETRR